MVNRIPTDLLAARIINAAGTLTRLSGARVSTTVAAAMSEAAQSSFDMWTLQAAASARIAAATGAEAGLVTTGASAGLTLAAAAAIAGSDVARMQALPFAADIPNEILVPRTHRNGYDRAITVAESTVIGVMKSTGRTSTLIGSVKVSNASVRPRSDSAIVPRTSFIPSEIRSPCR